MKTILVEYGNTSKIIATIGLEKIPVTGDYIHLFGVYYLIKKRSLILPSGISNPDYYELEVEKQ